MQFKKSGGNVSHTVSPYFRVAYRAYAVAKLNCQKLAVDRVSLWVRISTFTQYAIGVKNHFLRFRLSKLGNIHTVFVFYVIFGRKVYAPQVCQSSF